MKVYKEIEYMTSSTHLVKMICDLCRAETLSQWKKNDSDAVEIEIRLTEGFACSDGGGGTRIAIDLCPTCFKSQLVPWIQMQCGNVHVEEWDF